MRLSRLRNSAHEERNSVWPLVLCSRYHSAFSKSHQSKASAQLLLVGDRATFPAVLHLPLLVPAALVHWLLDAAGRRVMELRQGANDVSRLAAGVYFVREETVDGRRQTASQSRRSS
jgi:hypothetical protein